ncbi:NAD(P)H-dependent glycerol-3-phosphate dehydrogenase [Candidatus Berkiella aquae]|uniref:Glycerol-3-phosphate dehydrogenase [NAD(P)+] n=1 Tax=Candidatus Berkiella aquae TaxID=295108 RepID=A0A0Q9Z0T5_9GAMM|nr:NAD(P)H-dependent glycerol-3-phosphate dehydrogenase [Candidatus Berkiella aquae]MCS5712677.1 NAD(P)-dependent glycerol-3-phosphate dehydrogenase [Candidatus Berkiella aquae]
MKSFLVLGSGSWGSALALYLAKQGHQVVLWGHDPDAMAACAKTRVNEQYLPHFTFPANVSFSSSLPQAFQSAGKEAVVFLVVPSHAFAEVTKAIAPFLTAQAGIIWGTKGLSENGDLLHELCELHCGQRPMAVLSGPSFATEVAKGLPTAITIAANEIAFGQALQTAFHSEQFRVYLSDDMPGVELGGAVKNVLAIAVGMSDGLGYGANARSALITRGLAELCRLGDALGAKLATLMGLSGVGDIVLTCTDNQSRNRRFGLALGQGISQDQAEQTIGQVVEGKINAKQVMLLAHKLKIDMPICQQVYDVLFAKTTPQQAVTNLLNRPPKTEG